MTTVKTTNTTTIEGLERELKTAEAALLTAQGRVQQLTRQLADAKENARREEQAQRGAVLASRPDLVAMRDEATATATRLHEEALVNRIDADRSNQAFRQAQALGTFVASLKRMTAAQLRTVDVEVERQRLGLAPRATAKVKDVGAYAAVQE